MNWNPYLFFNGQCEEAINFYAQALGGKIEMLMAHEGTPAAEHVPPEWANKVMHAKLVVGDNVLMASDVPPGMSEPPAGFRVAIHIDDPAEAVRVFNALAEGGSVQMPLEQTFFAYRFGMLKDRFGIPWMVNCEKAP